MRKYRPFILILVMSCVMPLWAWSAEEVKAEASQTEVKYLMDINADKVLGILIDLMFDENYQQTVKDTAIVMEHAKILKTLNPGQDLNSRKIFRANAAQLELQATNIHNYAIQLQKGKLAEQDNDKTNALGSDLGALRIAAVSQYGQMLTTCVTCHNQFRHKLK